MMLLREAEAKTKACCKALEWYQGKLETAPCVASSCMAWRWNEAPGPRHPDDNREIDDRGFCGLAGKP